MNPLWPAELPQNPFANDGANYKRKNPAIATEMESGPDKVRRRFTAVPTDLDFTMTLSRAQWNTLDNFYRNTVKVVLPFDWIDFRSGNAATYRFKKGQPPEETYFAGDGEYWIVSIKLEMLP